MSDSPNTDDQGELFIKLYTKHESRLRNFVRSMVPTWESVDDRHVFSEDLLELLATEIEEEDEEMFVLEKQALRKCLEKVKEPHRELLLAAYAKGAKIKEVAEAAGKSPTSVYKLLNRVRASLHDCITHQLQGAEQLHAD
jgi:RNA polymerase sigma factor (sigma-70 family)